MESRCAWRGFVACDVRSLNDVSNDVFACCLWSIGRSGDTLSWLLIRHLFRDLQLMESRQLHSRTPILTIEPPHSQALQMQARPSGFQQLPGLASSAKSRYANAAPAATRESTCVETPLAGLCHRVIAWLST